jgi:signal transduction histidine kinase
MFTWGFIFVAAGIVFTIFILGIPLLIKAPKNQPTIIRIVGIALSFAILLSTTFMLLNQSYYSDFESAAPAFKSIFITLGPGIFTCFLLQALFIRSTRKSIFDFKTLVIFLVLAGLFLSGVFFFNVYIGLLEEPHADSKIAFNFYRSLMFSGLMIWCFYEVRESLKKQDNFIFLLIQILCGLLILQSVVWATFLIMDYRANGALGVQFGGMQNLDMNVRIIRMSIFCAFEILLSIYWVQHYSLNAIQERGKQHKIQQLLLEKDALIENLSNSSALIESGALSAGLAHELNQFLGRIALNRDEVLTLISQPGAKPEDIKLPLDNIQQANDSAAKLIVSLKKLFNRGEEDSSLCSVDDLVRDVVSLFQGRIQKSHIQIVMDLQASGQQFIWESLFRQVVVNLLSNAIDALDASFQSDKVIQIESSLNQRGDYCLIITDNGPGIDAQQGAKIFNLFASSKSSGTGIGLWLSRYIIERHKGSLIYRNLPGDTGVSFIATIPRDIKTSGAGDMSLKIT